VDISHRHGIIAEIGAYWPEGCHCQAMHARFNFKDLDTICSNDFDIGAGNGLTHARLKL
jgi:hypothetical protein